MRVRLVVHIIGSRNIPSNATACSCALPAFDGWRCRRQSVSCCLCLQSTHSLVFFALWCVWVSLTRAGGRVRAAAALRQGVRQGGADDQDRRSADTPAQKDGERTTRDHEGRACGEGHCIMQASSVSVFVTRGWWPRSGSGSASSPLSIPAPPPPPVRGSRLTRQVSGWEGWHFFCCSPFLFRPLPTHAPLRRRGDTTKVWGALTLLRVCH